MLSCSIIIPAEKRDECNASAEARGLGPNNYSVPLSPTGLMPATHFGLHAWVSDDFAVNETHGQIVSLRPEALGHFADLCAENGLVIAVAG